WIAEHVAEAGDALCSPLRDSARVNRTVQGITALGLKVPHDAGGLMLDPSLLEEEGKGCLSRGHLFRFSLLCGSLWCREVRPRGSLGGRIAGRGAGPSGGHVAGQIAAVDPATCRLVLDRAPHRPAVTGDGDASSRSKYVDHTEPDGWTATHVERVVDLDDHKRLPSSGRGLAHSLCLRGRDGGCAKAGRPNERFEHSCPSVILGGSRVAAGGEAQPLKGKLDQNGKRSGVLVRHGDAQGHVMRNQHLP